MKKEEKNQKQKIITSTESTKNQTNQIFSTSFKSNNSATGLVVFLSLRFNGVIFSTAIDFLIRQHCDTIHARRHIAQ